MRLRPYALVLAAALSTSLLAAACGSGSDSSDAAPIDPNNQRIEVVAKNFAYEPEDISVAAGDKTLVLHVKELEHDFTVKELDIHVHGGAGKTVTETVKMGKPGTYEIYCSIAGHKEAGMKGKLVIT